MKLDRTSQAITFQSTTPTWCCTERRSVPLFIPWLSGFGGSQYWFVGLGMRDLLRMHFRSGIFEFATRSLTLQLQDCWGRKRLVTCADVDVQDVEVFYAAVPALDGGSCGIRLKLKSQDLYLSKGGLPLEEARSIAQELAAEFGLSTKPPPYGFVTAGESSAKCQVVEKTEDQLVYRLSYSTYVVKLYITLGLLALFWSGGLLLATVLDASWMSNLDLMLGFCLGILPEVLLGCLMQIVGFRELWWWDRSRREFGFERKLLWGKKKRRFAIESVQDVVVRTQVATLKCPTYYHVGLDAPGIDLAQRVHNPVRVIFNNRVLQEAIDFAQELEYYLTGPAE
ncbi:MAG: hypothetical protein HC860_16695 [Alkalinema sp. RU_4_3]|nr:hypothetical protein [Alkalinema sp. RU_4_3]